MILSKDLFKSDFQVKKRYRNVFNTRDNQIGLSRYGSYNPEIFRETKTLNLIENNSKIQLKNSVHKKKGKDK